MEITIQVIVSMRIPSANLPALQQLIPAINERVLAGEPETLLYRWYFGEENDSCTLHEGFPSEEAFFAHLKNVEPVLAELFGLAPIAGWKIFGNISAGLKEGLRAFGKENNVSPEFSNYVSGFARH